MRTIAVVGAGSWGTALSIHLGRLGHEIRLWAWDPGLADEMSAKRENPVYLPDAVLPAHVHPTDSIPGALADADVIVTAIPSHACRAVMQAAAPHARPGVPIVSATKGLEGGSLLRISEVIAQEFGAERPVVVLSGPSFAREVANEKPTAVLAASTSPSAIELVQEEFRGPYFRIYGSSDVVGVEIGAAMKNVIAIAAGVVEGCGLGRNALAALITRGLAEITRLACAAGGRRETLSGLSGLGDLVLTCTGDLSRNRHVGVELARGRRLEDVLADTKMVAEGVRTCSAALALGRRYNVELPIAEQMAEVLAGRCDIPTAIDSLMVRRQRSEAETG